MTAALVAGGPVTLAGGRSVRRRRRGQADRRSSVRGGLPSRRGGRLPRDPAARGRAAPDRVSAAGPFGLTQVDEGAICTAMLELYQNEGIIAEPAGALAVTALESLDGAAGSQCRVPGVRWQQRRLALRRDHRAVARAPRSQALLPRGLPAGARMRCAGSSTRCSAPTTTSPCSSTSSATTARRVRRWSVSNSVRQRVFRRCSTGWTRRAVEAQRLEPGSPAYRYLT